MAIKARIAEDYFDDSKKLIGIPVHDPHTDPLFYQVDVEQPLVDGDLASKFSRSLGDDNPLYTDPRYGRRTRWGTMLVHPTIFTCVRYAVCRGALGWAHYPISSLVGGFFFEFNDVIRVGDSFESSFYLRNVFQKRGRTGRLTFCVTETKYWNQYKELVATGGCNNIGIAREVSPEEVAKGEGVRADMIYDRGIYKYSKEEIEKIVDIAIQEKRRGSTPQYWEDIKVHDNLYPIVKGPLTMYDMWIARSIGLWPRSVGNFELSLRQALAEIHGAGTRRVNPATGWPYETSEFEHYDWNLCKGRGLPAPFDRGVMRVQIMSHLLSNWMGDDGFIRRLEASLRKPNYYGDTTFYDGEVTKKYEEMVDDHEYRAVDIKISATNQLGETTCQGNATIYLPSHERGFVKLPVPHEDQYASYEKYLKDCEYVNKFPVDPTTDTTEWRRGFEAYGNA